MQSTVFFISEHSGALVSEGGNIIERFRGFEEIMVTINEVKYHVI